MPNPMSRTDPDYEREMIRLLYTLESDLQYLVGATQETARKEALERGMTASDAGRHIRHAVYDALYMAFRRYDRSIGDLRLT